MTAVTSNTLGLLGLAHKAGKLRSVRSRWRSLRARHAKVVLLASDAAENTVRRAQQFSQTAKAPCVTAPFSKAELGWQLGRTSCAMLAITDNGMAASLLEKLAPGGPRRGLEPPPHSWRRQPPRRSSARRSRRPTPETSAAANASRGRLRPGNADRRPEVSVRKAEEETMQ